MSEEERKSEEELRTVSTGKLHRIDTIDNGDERIYVYEQTVHTIDKTGNEQTRTRILRRRYRRAHSRAHKMEEATKIIRELLHEMIRESFRDSVNATVLYKRYVKRCNDEKMTQDDIISYSVAATMVKKMIQELAAESVNAKTAETTPPPAPPNTPRSDS